MTTRFSQERRTRGQHSPGRVSPFQVLLAKQGGASVSTSTLGTVFPRRLRDRFATPLQKLLIAKVDAGKNLSLAAATQVSLKGSGSRKLVHIIDADTRTWTTKKSLRA